MSDELTQRVIRVMSKTQHQPEEKFKPESTFEELGIDSLDGINIVFALENEFNINIPDDGVKNIRTVHEMVEGVRRLVEAEAEGAVEPSPAV